MVFKRTAKPRSNPVADKILGAMDEEESARTAAKEAYEAGRDLEAADDVEGAIEAHIASCEAWQELAAKKGEAVPHEPYERLAILFRKLGDPAAEAKVLRQYIAYAGRKVHPKLEMRLERARELLALSQMED